MRAAGASILRDTSSCLFSVTVQSFLSLCAATPTEQTSVIHTAWTFQFPQIIVEELQFWDPSEVSHF